MRSPDIRIISAGAGSGKTWQLTKEMTDLVAQGSSVRPEGIVATTFTRKAAAELTERLRQRLLEKGREADVHRMEGGFIGTVNGVCGALLQHLAFEAGLSPRIEVIPEEEQQVLFNKAISRAMDEDRVELLNEVSERFGFESGRSRRDWREDLRDVIDAARSNGISPARLKECARKSVEGILALLSPASKDTPEQMDMALERSLGEIIDKIRVSGDTTKVTKEYLEFIEDERYKLRHGTPLQWSEWAKIAKASPGAKSRKDAEIVQEVVSRHPSHPRLHADIQQFIETLFDVAADALSHYERFKRERGLMDFVDQEAILLEALAQPEVQVRLREDLDVLLVDEFQDTSPIQLALFLKLAELVDRSIWVGDPKQSIYAFRGADPALMDAAVKAIGGMRSEDILKVSYRSRPELVRFTNHMFAAALSDRFPKEQVELSASRLDPKGASNALRFWALSGSNKEARANQVAGGVVALLDEAPIVEDKVRHMVRKACPGDIAILCRTHEECREIASALVRRGLNVAVGRPGLVQAPEGCLALACLRLFLNEYDVLANAEIQVLTHRDPNPEEWLQERLDHLAANRPSHEWGKDHPTIKGISALAARASSFSPAEALDAVIECVDLRRLVVGWGDSERRLGNLENLRSLAREYEEACVRRSSAASVGGFLLWLKSLASGKKDAQSEGYGPQAVNVLTCHAAKGLEWPIVLATGLDKAPRERVWGLTVVDDRDAIDLENPLAERWIRYWPWPYGQQKTGIGLTQNLAGTPIATKAVASCESEELRLLYVTLTRARDYLVLCGNEAKGNPWLDLALSKATLSIQIPMEDGEMKLLWKVEGGALRFEVLHPRESSPVVREIEPVLWVGERVGIRDYPPAKVNPSSMVLEDGANTEVGEIIELSKRTVINGKPPLDQLGQALHDFIAADDGDSMTPAERVAVLQGILGRYKLNDIVEVGAIIRQCDALYAFLKDRFGATRIFREWPVIQRLGKQTLNGTVDMIADTPEGWVVVDHKIFPGGKESWKEEAASHAAQLNAYAGAIAVATGRNVIATFIHFLIGGGIVQVRFKRSN